MKKTNGDVIECKINIIARNQKKYVFLCLPNGEIRHIFNIILMKGHPVMRQIKVVAYEPLTKEIELNVLHVIFTKVYRTIVQMPYAGTSYEKAWLGNHTLDISSVEKEIVSMKKEATIA